MKKFLPPKLIIICMMISLTNPSTLFSQTPLSFTKIPYSDPDIISPGRGAEQWHNGSEAIDNPTEGSPQQSLDVYYRFTWNRLEGATQGSYTWTYFDNLVKDAIDHGQKLSFGIMTCYGDEVDEVAVKTYDGGVSAYPLYLHTLMQAETANSRDWLSDGMWIPNWNSTNYLGRLRALHDTLYGHIMATSYTATDGPHEGQSIAFKDAIYCIDIRGYGNYGEWHSGGICNFNAYPTGRQPTNATLKTIIDHHTQVFDDWPLVMMVAAYDGAYTGIQVFGIPAEVSYYALTATNAWGNVGFRRDQWGATDSYLNTLLAGNNQTYGGSAAFKTYILDKYKTAPVTGEPPRYENNDGPTRYWDLEDQIDDYGATSFGNGNWGITMDNNAKANARAAFKKAGYRILVDTGSISNSIVRGTSFFVTLNWKNVGNAPTYEDWSVSYELKNSSDVVVWTAASAFTPDLLFLPSGTATVNTDNTLTIPTTVPNGTYKLNLIIKDPSGYRAPLPLAITGRNADGSYTLKTITFSGGCTNPTAILANTPACSGGAFNLTLSSATGASPYDLVINGTTYNDKTIGNTITSFTPTTQKIWTTSPSVINNEDNPVELGVKFQSSASGYIKGLRFFSSDDISDGTYVGNLWSSTGVLLGSVEFENVTAHTWNEALFPKPIPIAASTTYVASYFNPDGYYASTTSGLTSAVTNGSLTALASGGVYVYGASGGFPTSTFSSSNYWADVLFVPDTYTFNLTSITDNDGCNNTAALQTLTVTSTQPSAVLSNTTTCNGQNFNVTLSSATGASPFDLVINGTTYNDKTVSSTIITAPTVQKIWTTNPSVTNNEDNAVELGVKFQSSVSGYIRGVRFFSSDDVGGTYKGSLWSSAGTLLQGKNFTGVTALGWQEVIFDAPIAIAANTTYVASYHTTEGYYASTTSGLSSAVTNGSLTALASGTSGGNGVYTYGSISAFPTFQLQ